MARLKPPRSFILRDKRSADYFDSAILQFIHYWLHYAVGVSA